MESMNVTVSEKEALVQVCVLKVGKTDLQTTVLLAAVPGSAEGESREVVCVQQVKCTQ